MSGARCSFRDTSEQRKRVAVNMSRLLALMAGALLAFWALGVLPHSAEAATGGRGACYYHTVAYTTGATACVDTNPNTVSVVDTLADGHHAAAYWSIGSLHGRCDAIRGVNTSNTCHLPVSGHPRVCIRAANMEGDGIVQDHLGSNEESERMCVTAVN